MDDIFPQNYEVYAEAVAQSLGVDEETLSMLLETFFGSTINDIKLLGTFVDESDFYNIKLKAHELKGASGSMRFDYLANLLKLIEIAAIESRKSDSDAIFEKIEAEFQRLQTIYQNYN